LLTTEPYSEKAPLRKPVTNYKNTQGIADKVLVNIHKKWHCFVFCGGFFKARFRIPDRAYDEGGLSVPNN